MKVWFHCSSIGELNAITPLIKKFDDKIISVFTKSGYEYAKKNFVYTKVYRYFFDDPFTLKRILSEKPEVLIIAETEIWPNLINSSYKNGIKIFLVNGRLSDRSFRFYKMFSFIFEPIFKKFLRIYAKSKNDMLRFKMLKANDVVFLGDLKVDAVSTNIKYISRQELGFKEEDFIITFGSVRSKEIEKVLNVVEYFKNYKFIIAPRHLDNVQKIIHGLNKRGIDYTLRVPLKPSRVLILNSLGELKGIYKISDICFVGGTLENYGGHNILESLYFKKPTIIGPYYKNVKNYVNYFKDKNAIFVVKNEKEMIQVIEKIANDNNLKHHIELICEEFFQNHVGATDKVYEDILDKIKNSSLPFGPGG
jgi:3-deoxy-D-manno-octulosonic-acid transferase